MADELFGTDRTIQIEDRVDNAFKRLQKLSVAAKATLGQTSRGDSSACKRGYTNRRGGSSYNGGRQQFGRQRDYDYDYKLNAPPSFVRYNGGVSGSCGGNGGSRDIGPLTCYVCESTSQSAKQCPIAS